MSAVDTGDELFVCEIGSWATNFTNDAIVWLKS